MRLRNEISLAVGLLLSIQLATSVGTTGLLSRMTPALEMILRDNVTSVAASQDMLTAIALDGVIADADREALFDEGLVLALDTVTLPEEKPLVALIERQGATTLYSAGPARGEVVDALRRLTEVNIESIAVADHEAQRMGIAGAWAASLLGVLSFGASVLVSRRLTRRIDQPIADIDAALQAARLGDLHRRCYARDVPDDLQRIVDGVNRLLDRPAPWTESVAPPAPADRVALLLLLDRIGAAAVVVDPKGVIRSSNDAANALFATPRGEAERKALSAVPTKGAAEGWTIEPLPGRSGWLCTGPTNALAETTQELPVI